MSKSNQIDYLIVGQGIAGTVLAQKLLSEKKSIHIIDNGYVSSSSVVAGGITHPMSFKRIILSWKADVLIPIAKKFYNEIEQKYNTKIFHNLPMTRLFSSMEEQNNWQGRMADPPLNNIIDDSEIDLSLFNIEVPFGKGKVNLAGRLDVSKFLTLSKSHFIDKQQISTEEFDYDKLIIENNLIRYKELSAQNIVFCEGYKFTQNPYFNYLPYNPTKGEILIIKTKQLPNSILSKGVFVMPIGDDKYVLGATYDRENINQINTKEGETQLLEKLNQIGDFDFEIIEHKAGVRPTTHNRRPLIGTHPNYKNIHIFNGMGSKGVMLAPHFADQFILHIENKKELEKEVNIDRYSKKHLHKCSV